MTAKIRTAERTAILNSLRAGLVPRIGLQHLQVGRVDEVRQCLNDLDQIGQGVRRFAS